MIGATASIAQLATYVLKTTKALVLFSQEVDNVPSELEQVRHRLLLLAQILDTFQNWLDDCDEEILMPAEVRSCEVHWKQSLNP